MASPALIRSPQAKHQLGCFSLELSLKDPKCQACSFQIACISATGTRAQRVPLTDAKFKLLPEAFADANFDISTNLVQIYAECYRLMFGNSKPDNILKHEGALKTLSEVCSEFGCSLKLFMLTVMHGHKQANPVAKFWSSMLLGEAAKRRMARYSQAVIDVYGSFDDQSLSSFANDNQILETTERRLIESEQLAGSWVVGFKIKQSGKAEMPFYTANEIRLDTLWLALEPSYTALILLPWLKARDGTEEQYKLRVKVAKLRGEFKRDSKRLIAAFKIREKIMPQVVKEVVARHGLNVRELEVANIGFEPMLLWNRIGLAIQHLRCLEYYSGNKQALRKLSSGLI